MSGLNTPQTLVENIDLNLADGMPVYDGHGDRVGDVKMYSTTAGYLMVGHGIFNQQDLYIPFRLIRSIDLHDLFLSETKENLFANYTEPPKISTLSEQRLVIGQTVGSFQRRAMCSGCRAATTACRRPPIVSMCRT